MRRCRRVRRQEDLPARATRTPRAQHAGAPAGSHSDGRARSRGWPAAWWLRTAERSPQEGGRPQAALLLLLFSAPACHSGKREHDAAVQADS